MRAVNDWNALTEETVQAEKVFSSSILSRTDWIYYGEINRLNMILQDTTYENILERLSRIRSRTLDYYK